MLDYTSQTKLINTLTEMTKDLSTDEKLDKVEEMTGQRPETENADMLLKYVTQGIETGLNVEEALREGEEKTNRFVEKHGITDKVTKVNDQPVDRKDPDSKKSRARVIFQEYFGKERPKRTKERFMDELDMSPAGAQTYYYTLKKEFGV